MACVGDANRGQPLVLLALAMLLNYLDYILGTGDAIEVQMCVIWAMWALCAVGAMHVMRAV